MNWFKILVLIVCNIIWNFFTCDYYLYYCCQSLCIKGLIHCIKNINVPWSENINIKVSLSNFCDKILLILSINLSVINYFHLVKNNCMFTECYWLLDDGIKESLFWPAFVNRNKCNLCAIYKYQSNDRHFLFAIYLFELSSCVHILWTFQVSRRDRSVTYDSYSVGCTKC